MVNINMIVTNASQMNYELQDLMQTMINEITRSGYYANTESDDDSHENTNPFMASGRVVTISSINSGTNNCILFMYDRDKNGVVNTAGDASSNEHFGFRLKNNTVQGLTSDQNYSCTETSAAWVNLSDPATQTITSLSFTPTTRVITLSGGGTLTITLLTITVTGQSIKNMSNILTLTRVIRLRNDIYAP